MSGVEEVVAKQESPAKSNNRERMLYIAERIALLQEETKALRTERSAILASLRKLTDKRSPEAKKLKRRRIYVVIRPEEVKSELAKLLAERQALAGEK